ncbi:Bifunctional DNA primase/polymerase, N-terminal [Saccharopolyspora shandongensis]|uniref:Bifunctional DNA primase/polymerase, N-terminal n=2 Tax=Saccharopolyspora shandongensis TaxID=418495 RepID=A0A1H3GA76_9PSEU|nr:Bifunctional DNA primase/polymerase, N-terminal [Saccharopolyspora shandongensis]
MRWTELRDAATELADHQWPLVPGTYQVSTDSPWLGKSCSTGLVPITELSAEATTDLAQVWEWWTRRPYSVLLACGRAIDALEVPTSLGRTAEDMLAALKLRGPVAVTRRTWLVFVESAGQTMPLVDVPAPVTWHSGGSFVPLPPTIDGDMPYYWRITPEDVDWRLPEATPTLDCLQQCWDTRETDTPIPV